MREKYIMIRDVLLRVQNGETLSSLRRASYSLVNVWVKKLQLSCPGNPPWLLRDLIFPSVNQIPTGGALIDISNVIDQSQESDQDVA